MPECYSLGEALWQCGNQHWYMLPNASGALSLMRNQVPLIHLLQPQSFSLSFEWFPNTFPSWAQSLQSRKEPPASFPSVLEGASSGSETCPFTLHSQFGIPNVQCTDLRQGRQLSQCIVGKEDQDLSTKAQSRVGGSLVWWCDPSPEFLELPNLT